MRERRPHREQITPEPPPERWLVSYADFVTLLLAFFITMYAITRLDSENLAQAQLSIHRALHAPVFPGGFPWEAGVGSPFPPGPWGGAALRAAPPPQLEEVVRLVQESLRPKPYFNEIRLLITARGLVIHLPEFLFYQSGEAAFRPESHPILESLADILAKIPNHVVIEGHTDNRPIHTSRFPSNWELSAHRATNLVRYFMEKHRLDPARFAAAGYGEYAPIADNATEEGRRLNRRVDVIIRPLVKESY
jgi:chemotaxis protein MotB